MWSCPMRSTILAVLMLGCADAPCTCATPADLAEAAADIRSDIEAGRVECGERTDEQARDISSGAAALTTLAEWCAGYVRGRDLAVVRPVPRVGEVME